MLVANVLEKLKELLHAREVRALHSVLSNLNFDIRPVHFRAILTERAAFKLE